MMSCAKARCLAFFMIGIFQTVRDGAAEMAMRLHILAVSCTDQKNGFNRKFAVEMDDFSDMGGCFALNYFLCLSRKKLKSVF